MDNTSGENIQKSNDDGALYRLIDQFQGNDQDQQLLSASELLLTRDSATILLNYIDSHSNLNALQLASVKGLLSAVELLLRSESRSERPKQFIMFIRYTLFAQNKNFILPPTIKLSNLLKKDLHLAKSILHAAYKNSLTTLLSCFIDADHFESFMSQSEWEIIIALSTVDIFMILLQHFDLIRELYPDRRQLLLSTSCKYGRLDFVKAILDNFDAVVVNVGVLCAACGGGDLACVQYLLTNHGGAFLINDRDFHRHTPLVHAIKEGHFHVVKLLRQYPSLRFGEILRDPVMEPVLHNACFLDKFNVVRYLLDNGVNPVTVRNAKLPAALVLTSWMAEKGHCLRSNYPWAYDLQQLEELDVPFHRLEGAFWLSKHSLHADQVAMNRAMISMGLDCCTMVTSIHNMNNRRLIPAPPHVAVEEYLSLLQPSISDTWCEMGAFDQLILKYDQKCRSSLLIVCVKIGAHSLAEKIKNYH